MDASHADHRDSHHRLVGRRVATWPGRVACSLFGCLLFFVGCGRSTEYPNQPITIICPWSAGGGTDRVARQMAMELETELGVPVNVINATGGGGVTGHTRGAQARGDGYTLSMITVELSMLHWRGLTNLTHRDFAPLYLLNRDSAALFVRSDSRFQSLADLRSAIAAAPKTVKASGTAFGGIWHIALAGWLDSQGLAADDATWISINGAGPSIQELLAGGVDVLCCSLPEADAVLAGGQVRCLGVMAPERVAGFESVPTFVEQGHSWSIAGWRGLAAPPHTPAERLEVVGRAIEKITQGESFAAFMQASGFDVSLENAAQFAETLENQDALFGKILTKPAFQSVAGDPFGPMIFPMILGVALAIVFVVVMGEISREQKSARMAAPLSIFRPLAVLGAVMFYTLASEAIGFILSACLMLSGLLLLLKVPRVTALVVAIATAIIVYQVFAVSLRVPLPRGILEW